MDGCGCPLCIMRRAGLKRFIAKAESEARRNGKPHPSTLRRIENERRRYQEHR